MSLGFDEAQEVQCLFEVKVPSCDNGKVLVCAINEHFPDAGDTLWIRRFQLSCDSCDPRQIPTSIPIFQFGPRRPCSSLWSCFCALFCLQCIDAFLIAVRKVALFLFPRLYEPLYLGYPPSYRVTHMHIYVQWILVYVCLVQLRQ